MTPYTLKETTQTLNTQAGKIDIHIFASEQGGQSLMVLYSDYPANLVKASDPEKIYDGGRDGAVANVKGQLVSESRIWLYGSPGREILIKTKASNGQDATVRDRIYLVGNRLYQVMAVVPSEKENSSEITSFLDSFKLLGR